jgi:hypothetical protein
MQPRFHVFNGAGQISHVLSIQIDLGKMGASENRDATILRFFG